jgi:ATP-dependent helicase/nuclease subunit B
MSMPAQNVDASSNALLQAWAGLWAQVSAHLHRCHAHPARTLVLLPFFQLQAVARQSAHQLWHAGFLPRLETTNSWQQRVAPFTPDALDLSFDAALDALRARQWLQRSGLASQQAVLAPLLVEAAWQLGGLAAAVPPAQRAAWAATMRPVVAGHVAGGSAGGSISGALGGAEFAAYETAVARIALEWAAASRYASDALFEFALQEVDALIVVRGVQPNALTQSLAQQLPPERCLWLDLPSSALGELHLHEARDAEDEAQAAAACVIAQVAAGRVPVALPAIDRLLTRRVSAMLLQEGITLRDETGWKLSTTRAAANLMSLLRAAHPLATQDEQLDWFKQTHLPPAAVQRLEQALRMPNVKPALIKSAQIAIEFIVNGEAMPASVLLADLRAPRSIVAWLEALKLALQRSGQWAQFEVDAAGQQLLAALHLQGLGSQAILQADATRMSLSDFVAWVQTALEAASFKPPAPEQEAQVVVLPLAQLAARPFAALVMAGCDENQLPLAPPLQGLWSTAQREALGLSSREQLAREQHTVWQRAMQVPHVDVLWRRAEGEAQVQRSPLLQSWQLVHAAQVGKDARLISAVAVQATRSSAPQAGALAQGLRFSASSYSDLRTCPYRFFALRLLGLQEAQELDEALSKRDFGSWLHEVLSHFHRSRPRETDAESDAALLDACAAQAAHEAFAQDPGFVPFAAAWPQVRQSYLQWLQAHESQGWRFESSELEAQLTLANTALHGRLDRVDLLAGSGGQSAMVIDYKTENASRLANRVKEPLEDTQLVFYAALLGQGNVRAAYLGLAEKSAKLVEQKQVNEALPLLLEGLQLDAQRIAAGHALPALGEGRACEHCAARGLCRKDFWALERA